MKKIIHISDMHFGRIDAGSTKSLAKAFGETKPDLVVISGDITQRASSGQFKEAREFLSDLKKSGTKHFVVPGNHDIEPFHKPLRRIFDPYRNYKKYISEVLEPTYMDEEVAISGIDTTRNFNLKDGNISLSRLKKVQEYLSRLPSSLFRIVVTHHPLDLPILMPRKKLARRAYHGMKALSGHNVDLYLSGHHHRSSIVITKDRYGEFAYSGIAAQAGTVSLRQRGEVQSFNVIHISKPDLSIETYLWDSESEKFTKKTSSNFLLDKNGWQRLP